MASFSIHGARGARIAHELPFNGLSLEIRFDTGDDILLFFDDDVEGWWKFRRAAVKAKDYWLTPKRDADNITDHALADKAAEAFYYEKRAELARRGADASTSYPSSPPASSPPSCCVSR